eukprot:jgi/Botrbrau1/18951/Bobra.0522s0003.1
MRWLSTQRKPRDYKLGRIHADQVRGLFEDRPRNLFGSDSASFGITHKSDEHPRQADPYKEPVRCSNAIIHKESQRLHIKLYNTSHICDVFVILLCTHTRRICWKTRYCCHMDTKGGLHSRTTEQSLVKSDSGSALGFFHASLHKIHPISKKVSQLC